MSLNQRIRGAIDGFKLLRRDRDIYEAIVRPVDVHSEGRYKRHELQALTARYCVSWVYIAAGRNATAVASVPLRWYTRSRAAANGKSAWDTRKADPGTFGHAGWYARKAISQATDVTEIVDPLHPALSLFETVNPWLNGFELMEQTQLYLGLAGNAYWAVVRENGIPSGLWPLQPQFVDVLPDQAKFIKGYNFGRGHEVMKFYDAADIIHFKNPNPNDPYYGMGDLAACLDDADLSVYLTQAAMSMLKNGIQPGVVVSLENASETDRATVEKGLNGKHAGAWKWWKALVFRGKTNITTLDIGEGSTKFLALPSDKVRDKIANCFGMSSALLTMDSAALATAKAAMPQWQSIAILPRCRRIEDQINARLTPLFGDPNLFCSFDNAVADDVDALTVREVSKFGARITTKNEARAPFKLAPVEGGDEFEEPEPVGGFGEETDRDSTAKGLEAKQVPRRLSEWPVARA